MALTHDQKENITCHHLRVKGKITADDRIQGRKSGVFAYLTTIISEFFD